MIRILGFLWSGCWHVWEPQSQGMYKSGFREGPIVHCKCKKCGRWTYFTGILKNGE